MTKKVLMVVTTAEDMGGDHKTGLWLSEFGEAFLEFNKAGYDVTIVSPKGGEVPIDSNSLADISDEMLDTKKYLTDTKCLDEVESAEPFDAIFLPGGHGTMFDFPDNTKLQTLIRDAYEADKIVAAVCHGPAGLVGVTLSNGEPLVKGKTVTGFTDEEERETTLDKYMPFLLESRLRELGANFKKEANWAHHMEVDGKLITGQNPQSTELAAQEVVRQLGK